MKKTFLFLSLISAMIWISSCTETLSNISFADIPNDGISIEKGSTHQLTVIFTPSSFEGTALTWISDNKEIAEVNQDGLVTAIECGETTISAEVNGLKASCKVTVVAVPAESIEINKNKLTLIANDSFQLEAKLVPDNAGAEITWSSSDEEIATVDDNGMVNAISKGHCTISAAAGEISANCEITVLQSPKAGDIYYSDGTYSETLLEDKTPIGVVFYTENPAQHDKALANDHPTCTHGLVVALSDESSAWQENVYDYGNTVDSWRSDNMPDLSSILSKEDQSGTDFLNKIMGYNNTKAIEAFNNAEENAAWPVNAISKVIEYRKSVQAPENTSDWYLPSAKEVSIICSGDLDENIYAEDRNNVTNRDFLNTILTAIPGGEKISSSFYWPSTEYDEGNTYAVYFKNGSVLPGPKDYQENRVRFVLAF